MRVGVIGAGKFASMFLTQALHLPAIHLAGVVDLDPERARSALARTGWPAERYGAPSLAEARANYARIGASDPDSLDRVRKPRPEEHPNPEVDNDATRITRLEAAVLSVFSASVREAARLVPGHLRVQRREIEPVGFFTHLEPSEATRVFPNNRNLAWSGLGARFGTVDVGFVVFVNAGCVTMIEGYTYGDDWPSGEPDALYSI